jgi:short-subunit dehydrogenase
MNIVITGAGKGIGFAMVKYCIEKNFSNIIAISKNTLQLEKLKGEIENPKQIHIINFDLQNFSEYDALLLKIKKVSIQIDYLINNAGILINKPFDEISISDMIDTYNINVFAPFLCIQKLSPYLKNGAIVNISSMGAVQGSAKFEGLTAYSSSKAAIACLTEVLALELKKNNISCNTLALGAVQTEMLSNAFPNYTAETTPIQMAKFIIDFAKNTSKLMNGKIIQVSNSTP